MPATSEKRYFKLFSCCLPVKGARRSVICDVQRTDLQSIPNDLYDILVHYKNRSIDDIRTDYSAEVHDDIDAYFTFLEKGEYGFWCSNPMQFPDMNLHWERPYAITNAIIDINESSQHNYKNIFDQLNDLGCIAIQLRCYNTIDTKTLENILKCSEESRLRCMELFIKYSEETTQDIIEPLLERNPIISTITIHSAPFNKEENTKTHVTIHYTTKMIDNNTHCGVIHNTHFSVTVDTFTEAQQFNTCLNRKIAIDTDGSIKNCPSFPKSYGNITDTSLSSVIQLESFKELWNIHKDQIEVCKDCEFRYVCSDCRAFTQKDNIYSKPSKCKYNPYTAEWEI